MRLRSTLAVAGQAWRTLAGGWRRRSGDSAVSLLTDREADARRSDPVEHAPALGEASSIDVLSTLALELDDGKQHIFVAVLEIERFALLRQRVGYRLANEVVAAVTDRLTQEIVGCRVGRVGRTTIEFAFAAGSFVDAQDKLDDLVRRIEQPIDVQRHSFNLFVTVGAADAGHGSVDDRLLDLAESALTEARTRHLKSWIAETGTEAQSEFDYVGVMRELRDAMTNGELSLHYQPKLCAKTDSVKSCEALLRWHHPLHGQLRTDRLIEAAEVTGAIRDITYWVIERALADRAELAARDHHVQVFVNISAILLPERTFADWSLSTLRDADGGIGFEITETAVIKDPTDAIANLQLFADAGIRIAIDDYGSGLSSLAYLKQLPAHELKIDQMFVSGLTESNRDPLLVRSTIDLAHALEMQVTAEGVDNPMSLALLRIMGCDLLQGHEISRPLPLDEFETFLSEHSAVGVPRPAAWNVAGWTGDAGAALKFG